MVSFPMAALMGLIGIVADRRKWLAATVTLIAGGAILLVLSAGFLC